MNPRNSFEREVLSLHTSLKPLTLSQKMYGFRTCRSTLAIYKYLNSSKGDGRRSKVVCNKCDAHFEYKGELYNNKVIVCPYCHKKIKVIHKLNKCFSSSFYYLVVDRVKDYQVFRQFIVTHRQYWRKREELSISEDAYQVWLNDKGQKAVIARPIAPMTYDNWRFTEPMILKRDTAHYGYSKYNCEYYSIYNRYKIIPELRKRGIRTMRYKDPFFICLNVLKNSKYETLIKSGYDAITIQDIYTIDKYWPQIKIAIRHKWKAKDWGIWFDMLGFLAELNKDIHNPYYILPENLSQAHDYWHIKARLNRDLEKLYKEMAKNSEYIKQKQKFFGICIKSNGLFIEPLKSIKDFYNEGSIMKHCVFTNKYYDKKDSLCLSCKDEDGNRIETIELSLSSFRVLQSRGVNNSLTDRHDDIVNLVESNKKMFLACMTQ